MAKRRKLEAPSRADLNRLEEEFRRETSDSNPMLGPVRGAAPIAQVAADTAARAHPTSASDRARQAQLEASKARLQKAEEDGRLLVDLPVSSIDADAMVRDRTSLDPDDMFELRQSIAANGLRLPIEVFELQNFDPDAPKRYGLLSGYRRLMAVRELRGLNEDDSYSTIRAIVRERTEADTAFVAMVEENEVRAELSQFERGRIAVISAQQGAFINVEDAVNKLFATGSKAKRSKVRSFALIFEELGDMLEFPDAISEKRGLRLAQALRQGGEARIRAALAVTSVATAEEEWAKIAAVIDTLDAPPRDPKRGGRPSSKVSDTVSKPSETIVTSAGVRIGLQADTKGYVLRFEGAQLSEDTMVKLLHEVGDALKRLS